jgi:hypothetical protein
MRTIGWIVDPVTDGSNSQERSQYRIASPVLNPRRARGTSVALVRVELNA